MDPKQSHYDVLEIKTDASPQEIRDAYLRIKNAYSKDSVAVYSLVSPTEVDQILKRAEEAYQVLSHDAHRRHYDQGFLALREGSAPMSIAGDMRDQAAGADLLVAPKTDSPTPHEKHPLGMELEVLSSISKETEWKGTFLQSVRKARQISIEELSEFAKVSKTYLRAIEDEDFAKLPAIVFVRGFLVQVCRKLKLPEDKVLPAYLERFKKAKGG